MKDRRVFFAVSGLCLLGFFRGFGGTFPFIPEEHPLPAVSRMQRIIVGAPEQYQNLAICQTVNSVNVRQQPNTNSAVVGKMPPYSAADIVATVNGEGGNWYQIQSGSVNGYVKAEYFLTGAQAEAAAAQIGTRYAAINTPALRLRAEPNTSSQTLTTLLQGAEYIMLGEENHFAKLSVDEMLTGYVSMDYIKTRVELPQAVSLAEEAAQQAEEARRRQEAQEALQKLEEVKMVEAKNDFVSIPATQINSNIQNNSTGLNGLTGGENLTAQTGTGSFDGAVTVAPNPLGQADTAQTAAAGTAPTLAGADIVSPVIGSGNTLADISRNQHSVAGSGNGNTVSYGPGGTASQAVVSATRTALVAYAKQFLGNPYLYGGDSLTNGADCSGFVMRIFEHFGISTGRNSREQAGNGRQIAIEAVQPGDLLFYASGDTINHVAIYIGGGQVIHAASAKTGIIISPSTYRTPCRAVTFLD